LHLLWIDIVVQLLQFAHSLLITGDSMFCAFANAAMIKSRLVVSVCKADRVSFIVTDNAANMAAARRLVVEAPGYV
jgi:hypothetical protein